LPVTLTVGGAMGRFDGQVALITGGGTGLGAAIAARFIQDGGRVVLMGRRSAPLKEVADSLGCASFAGDAGSGGDVRQAIALAQAQYGRLDVLMANAGGHGIGEALSTDDAEWAQALHTNLRPPLSASGSVCPSSLSARAILSSFHPLRAWHPAPASSDTSRRSMRSSASRDRSRGTTVREASVSTRSVRDGFVRRWPTSR